MTTLSSDQSEPSRGQSRVRRFMRRFMKRCLITMLALVLLGGIGFAIAWVAFPFPFERLECWPASPVVLDRAGRPMTMRVGEDDQWRVPVSREAVSPWLTKATIAVEDERFREHCGVDFVAVGRACLQNLSEGRVVSGASTLTMQVCRMMDDQPRTLGAKAVESFRALQLEQAWDKDTILETYLNIAPYGGNLRGVEAASLAYFGKGARDLSLAEAALLAGLPQSPTRLQPNRYPERARRRRATVLRRMLELGIITRHQHDEASAEPIEIAGGAFSPNRSTKDRGVFRHAVAHALRRRPVGGTTTIDVVMQREMHGLLTEHLAEYPVGTDAALVVIDIASGELRVMIGSPDSDDPVDGQVNGATAFRSPGSTLKPFIYAAAMDAGRLSRESTLYDLPITRAGWSPRNFDRQYRGEVSAAASLRESLNVPAILVMEQLGVSRCTGLMQASGVRWPSGQAQRASLSVAVGGVETTLLDLTNAYATLGRRGRSQPVRFFVDDPPGQQSPAISADACRAIDHVLGSHQRRPSGMESRAPRDVPWFMWKTGTSAKRRDAWAVGHNGAYAVGVWVGRLDGSGHHGYTGRLAAEPLLTRVMARKMMRSDPSPSFKAPAPLRVYRPLPKPRDIAPTLRITSPSDGTALIAWQGTAEVRLSATIASSPHPIGQLLRPSKPLAWFLNGRVIEATDGKTIRLAKGRHELRCVSGDGQHDAVRFTIR